MTTNEVTEVSEKMVEVKTAAPGVTKKRTAKKAAKKVANLKKKAVKKQAEKKVREKKVKEAVVCHCGCGETTKGGKFIPGHDARFHGRVKKLADGRMKMAELEAELGKSGAYALTHYKEHLKHADRTPYMGKEKKAPSKRGTTKSAKEKATKTPKAPKAARKPAKASKAKDDTSGATGDTYRVKVLRAIDRAGEMNTGEIQVELGTSYPVKPLLSKLVKDGHLTVTRHPKDGNNDNAESANYYAITASGKDFYKSVSEAA